MKKALSRKNLWQATPSAIKSALKPILTWIKPELLLGRAYRQTMRFIQQADRWNAEQAREYQLFHLRRICLLASRTPFYKRVFRQAGFDPRGLKMPEDLAILPMTHKFLVIENLEDMLTRPAAAPGVDCVSTSGTSGKPLRFYMHARRSQTEFAYLVSSWQRAGYRLGMPLGVLRGRPVKETRAGFHHEFDPILRQHFYSNFHTTDRDLRAYLDHLATLGPCFLEVYPSSAAMLAGFLERTGARPPANLCGLLAGSENVPAAQRQYVERIFGCRYFSWYGHTEKLVLAAECEHSSHYHVWPTYGYCELVDERGRPVREIGRVGEIVGTGFINDVTPFIRYRTGDYARYMGDHCDVCGRQQMVLADVEGRKLDGFLLGRDGSSICIMNVKLNDVTRIIDYQFHQVQPGKAVMRMLSDGPLSATQVDMLRRQVEDSLQGQIDIQIQLCQKLQLTAMGKAPRLIQETAAQLRSDAQPRETTLAQLA